MSALAKRLQISAAMLLAIFTFANDAFAWGDEGHKIVCEIAMRRVSADTRTEITRLMAGDQEFSSFVDACTWADHPRKRAAEHFLNLPRDSQGLASEGCGDAPTCIVSAIQQDARILGAKDSPESEKLAALKYLGHWVGDIHQPLHVSFRDDRGGSDIRVSGVCGPNLHAVWDTCLVLEAVGPHAPAAASALLDSLKPDAAETWIKSSPKDWANETFAIAEQATTGYCQKAGVACNAPGERVRIDRAYLDANTPVVRLQLLKAGVRLAHLLDDAISSSRR
jgi:hypothetical protein